MRSNVLALLGVAAAATGCGHSASELDGPQPTVQPAALTVYGSGAPVDVPAVDWCFAAPLEDSLASCANDTHPRCDSASTPRVSSATGKAITVQAPAGVDGLQSGNTAVTHGRNLTLLKPEREVTVITRPNGVDYAVYVFCVVPGS